MGRKKILIAEDDQDILLILQMVLTEAGYTVELLPDGKSIVEWSKEWPDLFILDKHMPIIDGLALSKYLRLKEETKAIPIIMISCYHKIKNKAKDVGIDAFIEKPFHLQDLLETVDKCMDHGKQAMSSR